MRTNFHTPALIVYLLAMTPAATAQQQPTAEERQRVEQHQREKNKQNFIGWKGVLFYCAIETQSNQALNEICERSYTNANFLAAAAKINLAKTESGYELGFRAVADDFLVLEVELTATKEGSPSAIHANLRAYKSYLKAADTSSAATKKKVRGQNQGQATSLCGNDLSSVLHLVPLTNLSPPCLVVSSNTSSNSSRIS